MGKEISDSIIIQAEQLKWCPTGFKFLLTRTNEVCDLSYISDELVYWFIGRPICFTEDVQVDAKEYEDVCIARIKEMCETKEFSILEINKKCNKVIVTTVDDSRLRLHIFVNCDPRPNEKEYKIEVSK